MSLFHELDYPKPSEEGAGILGFCPGYPEWWLHSLNVAFQHLLPTVSGGKIHVSPSGGKMAERIISNCMSIYAVSGCMQLAGMLSKKVKVSFLSSDSENTH